MTTPASNRTFTRVAGGLAALAIASLALPVGTAAADEGGDVDVVNTETVQVYTDASGEVQEQRIYEQLALLGNGSVAFDNPVGPDGLRNLDGFSGFEVSDGVQRVETDVEGAEHLRSVSDYEGELPLDLAIEYRLDGETVEPGDLVGESGELEVTYTVENVTGEPREISYPDGNGGTITETVDVPLPMVGSLSTTLPSSFTEVKSGAANMAGDGQGGTKLSFTMTLLPPIGSATATFGYTATIKDAVVPPAAITALPVDPMQSPTFASAAESYQGGADTGIELTAGAQEIDANLLKIRDGAAELLTGLVQLHEGSQELSAGLQGEAAPGAEELAAGARDLRDGLGQIDDGAGQLAGGAGRISDGVERLDDGVRELNDGAAKLNQGAGQLEVGANTLADGLVEAGTKAPELLDGLKQVRAGLVKIEGALVELSTTLASNAKAADGYQQLTQGVGLMISRIGTTSQPGNTLLYGLDQLRSKLQGEAVPGINQMLGGTTCAAFTLDMLRTGTVGDQHPCFAQLPGEVQRALKAGLLGGPEANPLREGLLQGLATNINGPGSGDTPTIRFGLTSLLADLERRNELDPGAIQALELLECGVSNASLPDVCDPTERGLLQGLLGVQAGIPQLVDGIAEAVSQAVGDANDTAADETFRGGVNDLIGGVDLLTAGGGDLLAGLGLLSDGANKLSQGTGRLDDGAGELAAGAHRLADGTGDLRMGTGELSEGATDLAAGTGDASDGSGRLADGAGDLAAGLGDAADGSGQLEDGLRQAREAAPGLPQGAERLSEEGMSQLVKAGKATAKDYGKLYATVAAGSERAQNGTMAFGAPDDARGLMAYSFEIKGEDGEGRRNVARGVGALVLGGLGLGAVALRRRFI